MDFQSALKKRKLSSNESVHSDSEKQAASKISSPTENEVILFWDELHQNLPKAAISSLRGKGKFSENFKPKSLFAEWPIDLSQLCLGSKDASFSDSSYEQVLNKCRRITASNFNRVCHTSISQQSLTVLTTMYASYGDKMPFYSAATTWGTKNKQTAKVQYSALVTSKHVNYKLFPQFGASPDGMISCDCCGDGCLEIKCPYSMKEKHILDVPWLQLINNKLTIDRKHTCYYQMQMFMSNRQDNELWKSVSIKALEFHSKYVMPELLCQYVSWRQVLSPIAVMGKEQIPISTQSDRKYCICGGDDDGRKMIMFESENCTKVWFHTSCIKLKHVPKGKWYCGECK
ncbi:hypothetical protein ACJMK2_020718 [Sinanodonta woodiana]|uniref:Zinc finger PHD-type domain-containing protein n=1 Tax=Sinanodonta woodiana TaxID=1069815 RepID=A0ABD3U120_SINWO